MSGGSNGLIRMSERVANCPNCGAPIKFLWSSAVQTTCEYCHSILIRRDVDLEFHDQTVYQYFGVPADVHEALLRAPSKGSYFNRAIRGRFAYTPGPTRSLS